LLTGGISLAENVIAPSQLPERGLIMKKTDFSEFGSNLLIFGSVTLAVAPFLLGDQLSMIVTGLIHQGGMMIDQAGNYLRWLAS
jgi:hypothetical protein